jgi:ABC-2 type transport system permease protein
MATITSANVASAIVKLVAVDALAQPDWLIEVMKVTPTPHFVSFSQNVLYRAAGLDIVWPQLAALAAVTTVYFGASLARFRKTLASFA